MTLTVRYATRSDIGLLRTGNEDALYAGPRLLAVADGMGGHAAGEVASSVVIATMAVLDEDTPSRDLLDVLQGAVADANAQLRAMVAADGDLEGMGTTLTAMLVHGGRAHVVHAGDSRCYVFRDGQLRQLTDDHSWIAEQLRAGSISEAEAKSSKFRHVITKSIGFERDIEADTRSVPVSAGDCFLLCSDGMTNYVEHGELERIVAMTWYRRLPSTLVDLANSRGGDDNITVVVGLVANAPPK